jgi:hypothetical protein
MARTSGRAYKIRHPKKKIFLERYRISGNVSDAARVAGISRQTFYEWRERDKKFAELATVAEQEALDLMEHEAWRRAVSGVKKPVYQSGKKVGVVREYSDVLLIFLLKARDPEKYREIRVQHEHAGKGGGPIRHQVDGVDFVDLSRLSDEELAQLEELVEKAAGSGGDQDGEGQEVAP